MILPDAFVDLENKLRGKTLLPNNLPPKVVGDAVLSGSIWDIGEVEKRKAAVLIALINRRHGINILLTERTHDLPSHAGQVAFPGGKVEEGDENIVHTALREAKEEVGLEASFISILGVLDNYHTGTGFDVSPVVGMVEEGFTIVPDMREVDEVFEVPLSFILNKDNHVLHSKEYKGAERKFYSMEFEGHTIWGATAAILVNLCYVLMHYNQTDN